jgi:hypothetical protein
MFSPLVDMTRFNDEYTREEYVPTKKDKKIMEFIDREIATAIAARDEAHKEEMKDEYTRGFNDGANEQYKIISKQQL